MVRYILITIISLFLVSPAFAQSNADPTEQQLQQQKAAEDQMEMLLGKKKAPEQPQTLDAYIQTFYQNCKKKKNPILAGNDLDLMCTCAAANIPDVLTLGQALEIDTNSSEAVFQQNRMLMFVYAPCVGYTVKTMLLNECMTNPKNRYIMKNQAATCGCIAQRVSKDMQTYAPMKIEEAIRRKLPKDIEALDVLFKEKDFIEKSIFHTSYCLHDFEKR